MINREITYVRDVSKSYMKIPAMPEGGFDEKILLKKPLRGLLPVEKCYINGGGQYWYNISGKQALDTYCRVNAVGRDFIESLLLRFCEQVEILEWNLMDTNCLAADPELIFVNHDGSEISFVFYPYSNGNLFLELQQLVEYLLTRLDHGDTNGVRVLYDIYGVVLTEGYSVADLKKRIMEGRMEEESALLQKMSDYETMSSDGGAVAGRKADSGKREADPEKKMFRLPQLSELSWVAKIPILLTYAKKLDAQLEVWCEKLNSFLQRIPRIEKSPVVAPAVALAGASVGAPEGNVVEDVPTEPVRQEYSTVCLSSLRELPQGRLVYEGAFGYEDLILEQSSVIIGNSSRAGAYIDRNTVSHFHARIENKEETYYIEDLNSMNGTYLNGTALEYKKLYPLNVGDKVRFADVTYRFC